MKTECGRKRKKEKRDKCRLSGKQATRRSVRRMRIVNLVWNTMNRGFNKKRTFNQIIDIQHWIRLTIDKSWIKNKESWPIIHGQLHWCQTEKDMPAFLLCFQSHLAKKKELDDGNQTAKSRKRPGEMCQSWMKNDFSGSIRAFFCHLMLLCVCGLRARHLHAALGWHLVEGEPLP